MRTTVTTIKGHRRPFLILVCHLYLYPAMPVSIASGYLRLTVTGTLGRAGLLSTSVTTE